MAPPDSLFKPEAKKPLLVAEKDTLKPTKEYETEVSDSLLKGTIYNTVVGEGYLANAEFTYKFKKPLFTTQRIDTIYETETRTIMEFVPSPKPFRVQAGIMAGAVPSGDFYFGPSIGILNRKDDYFSYSYDILNKGHFISYKKTIRIRK